MAAPSLPRGIEGPTRADFSSGAQTAQFVTVYTSPAEAWVWQTSGRRFLMELNAAVGRQRRPIWGADAFATLRDRLRAAGVDVSQVSASQWDRETLRAALWYAYRNGFAASNTSPGNVWLPTTLVFPPLGVVIDGSDAAAPPPVRLTGSTPATTTGGPTAAQRQAARDLDAFVRRTPSLRRDVRSADVETLQRSMGSITADGKYGTATRDRMRALGVSDPAPVPAASTGGGGSTGGGSTTTTPRPPVTPVQGALGGASTGAKALAVLVGVGLVVGAAVLIDDADTKRRFDGAPARSQTPRVPPRPARPTGRAPSAARVPYRREDSARRSREMFG